ncbi:ABC transporter [Streptomyces sulfonofaciens]|uniref:ABC transporter n=1 Tax=Streptomyces sulfonofaciens TaxID=68272 RepID=A0A919GH76_9ACTN|nr:ABC transporter permease subunit [Streptomyces sulfonofaciens]GHH83910.1 ABC transporter [Streptomyces sulfonofaciens]
MSGSGAVLRRFLGALGTVFSRYWTVLALLLAWELWVRARHLNAIVVPAPYSVVSDVFDNPSAYAGPLGHTLLNSVVGLALGMVLGLWCAMAVWFSRMLSGLLTPLLLVMRSVPVVVMIPVVARVVGFGTPAVTTITTLVSFFPTFVMVLSGLRAAPTAMTDVFAVLGASRPMVLRRLLLPHAVPELLVALRLTAPSAVLAAMLAEYLLGRSGLGTLFADAVVFVAPQRAWGAALIATVVSVACFVAARGVERRYAGRFR